MRMGMPTTLTTAAAYLLLSTTLVAAVTERQCALFEGPSNYLGSHPFIHVLSTSSQNTSVFISHIAELKDPFIQGIALDKRVRVDDDLFSLCTREAAGAAPNCTADIHQLFDTHKLTHRVLKFGIESSILSTGEAVSYEIEAAGVYCVLLHQDGHDQVQEVSITNNHAYGPSSSSSPGSIYMKALVWIATCLVLQLWGLQRRVNSATIPHGLVVSVWKLYGSVVASKIFCGACRLYVHWMLTRSWYRQPAINPPSSVWIDPLMMLDQLVSVFSIATVCQFLTMIHASLHPAKRNVLKVLCYRCVRGISHLADVSLFFVESGPLVSFLREWRCAQMATTILTWNSMREIDSKNEFGYRDEVF